MDEDAEKLVRANGSSEMDRISELPDSLLCQILLNIPTKDVVKSSLLSKRWRNLWRYVPGLDLSYGDFPEYDAFVSFVDRFLGYNRESCLQNFKLKETCLEELDYDPDAAHDTLTRWINTVLKRKVQHLHVLDRSWEWEVDNGKEIPPTVFTSESLISLNLRDVILANPKSVSLPSVKVIYLGMVQFANDWPVEMLISGCPVLQRLTIKRNAYDNVKVLRVCSQSLLSFTLIGHSDALVEEEELVVAIDAPRLEYLKLDDYETASFVLISNPASLVKVDIDIVFNLYFTNSFDPYDLPKRNMIRNFLLGISSAKDMVISSITLEAIYNYSRCERLSLFRNLSSLHANFFDYKWKMLRVFLESCPNLKYFSLSNLQAFSESPEEQPISILPRPHCFLPSLESVEIIKPIIEDEAAGIKLVSYFLENSTILKKLTIRLGDFKGKEESAFLKKLSSIPRLSSSCQVVIL